MGQRPRHPLTHLSLYLRQRHLCHLLAQEVLGYWICLPHPLRNHGKNPFNSHSKHRGNWNPTLSKHKLLKGRSPSFVNYIASSSILSSAQLKGFACRPIALFFGCHFLKALLPTSRQSHSTSRKGLGDHCTTLLTMSLVQSTINLVHSPNNTPATPSRLWP
jgi:S1-C subfamily serine protease